MQSSAKCDVQQRFMELSGRMEIWYLVLLISILNLQHSI
jgi:hypothetical protein